MKKFVPSAISSVATKDGDVQNSLDETVSTFYSETLFSTNENDEKSSSEENKKTTESLIDKENNTEDGELDDEQHNTVGLDDKNFSNAESSAKAKAVYDGSVNEKLHADRSNADKFGSNSDTSKFIQNSISSRSRDKNLEDNQSDERAKRHNVTKEEIRAALDIKSNS